MIVTLVHVVADEPRSEVLLELDHLEQLMSSAVVEERPVRLIHRVLDLDLLERIVFGKSWGAQFS